VEKNNIDVVKLLLARKADPNLSGSAGSPLHAAAQNGNLAAAQVLVQAGADLQSRDSQGKTPLHLAARNGNSHIMDYLLEKGADPNARDNNKETPLFDACGNNKLVSVQSLLRKKVNVKLRNVSGKTALYALNDPDVEIVRLLIQKGIPLNEVLNDNGDTYLHKQAYYGRVEVIKLLLEAGVNRQIKNKEGKTPFDVAQNEVTRQLLQTGK
jgi:ankyrin repeat protein